MFKGVAFFCLALPFVATVGVHAQADWYVSTTGNDANDGQSWATAFATIQKAVNRAVVLGSYEIWVAKGTYTLSSPISIPWVGSKIPIKIIGGFAGGESLVTQRDWVANPTIIDGNGAVESAIQVAGWVDLIDGFTITGGTAGGVLGTGGAIDIRDCGNAVPQPVLRNLDLRGNGGDTTHPPAYYDGGAVYIEDCSPWIINTSFSNNRVWAHGGALFARDEDSTPIDTYPKIVNSTFSANHSDVNGGAVGVYRGTLSIYNSILWGDTAGDGVTHEAFGGTLSVFHTDIDQDGFTGSGNIRLDPKLAGAGRFHLREGSPCIDAGDDALWPVFVDGFALDFDGDDRFLDGSSGSATIDMGADEYVPGATKILHVDGVSGSDANSGLGWMNALATIQAAVTAAEGFNADIWIKQGTYGLPGTVVLGPANANLGLYGGFDGSEVDLSERSGDASLTVIDGLDAHTCLSVDWTASPGDPAGVVLDGLTLDNCVRGVTISYASGTTIHNCRITGAAASGIYTTTGDLTISGSYFAGNSAVNGGAISVAGSHRLTVSDSAFVGNSAVVNGSSISGSGGAIMASTGTIERSIFTGNVSYRYGGAVYDHGYGDGLLIRNSVFSSNHAGPGGGDYFLATGGGTWGSVDIVNSSFTGNSAKVGAGGASGARSITNSILWNNSGDTNVENTNIHCAHGKVTYSDVGDPSYTNVADCQTPYGNISADPLFTNPGSHELALQSGSPAIDAGDSTALEFGSVDFAGLPRHVDDPSVDPDPGYGPRPAIDMGAYELQASTPATHYTLTMAVNGGGTTSPAAGDHVYLNGYVETVSATAAPGWQFTGWSGWVEDPASSVTTVVMSWDRVVTANFKKVQGLAIVLQGTGIGTVTSSPEGISCPPDCNEIYDYGTPVTLSVTTDPGTYFDGWVSSACTGIGDCALDMNDDHQVAALCNLEGGCGIGDEMTLANMVIDWAHWFEACTSISTGAGLQIVSPGDVVFRAGDHVTVADGFSVGSGAAWRVELSGEVGLRSIAVSKTADPASVGAGEAVTYTISVANDGQASLWQVSVLDDKCTASPVFQSGDDGDGALEPGETWVYECSGPAEATDFTNTATATFADTFGQEVTDSGTAEVTVGPAACATDRYVDLGDGTVLDCNYPDVVWLQDTSCDALGEGDGHSGFDPAVATYPTAVAKVALLADGICGLTDGSSPGDWFLPAMTLLCASWDPGETGQVCYEASSGIPNTGLIDNDCEAPAVETSDGSCPPWDNYPEGDPFIGIDTWGGAWSADEQSADKQWVVTFYQGEAGSSHKTTWRMYSVPVRPR